MRMCDQAWPHKKIPNRNICVCEVLTREFKFGTLVLVIQFDAGTHLRNIVMHTQFFLLTQCIANNENITQAVVIHVRPPLLNGGPHSCANVILHGFKQPGRNCSKRDFVAGDRVVVLWTEAASGLCGLNNRGAELWSPEGHLNHFRGYKASWPIVGCSLISEDGFKISHDPMLSPSSVKTGLRDRHHRMMRRTLSRDEFSQGNLITPLSR